MIIEGKNFVEKLMNLALKGWVKSRRSGNTGIGKTLEDLLGIPENNKKIPDFKYAELKTHRKSASSLVTLFTYDRDVWKINNAELIAKFGYWDDKKQRYAIYQTVTSKANNYGWYIDIDQEKLLLKYRTGEILAEWAIHELASTFSNKMPNLVYVLADSRMVNDEEEFWYNQAYYLEGVNEKAFISLLRQDIIVLDIRMHLKANDVARNHGTGFRINDVYLPDLFASRIDILSSEYKNYKFEGNYQKMLDDYLQ